MKLIPDAVGRGIAGYSLKLDASSPTILFGVGVAGMVGATVLACRATLKLSDTLEQTQSNLEIAKGIDQEKYDAAGENRKKDIAIIVARGAIEVTKLYLPSVIVGGLSIACLTKSHNILQERNTALMAAYAAVDRAFTRYRERVVEKHGKDEDRRLRYGSEEVDVVDDNGKIEKVEVVSRTPGEEQFSMYARFFDEASSTQFSKSPGYNLVFLRGVQSMSNDMLQVRGHLFLNEVYDALGMERTKAGSVVGWVYGKDGDNFVDFGLYEGESQAARDFINGREGAILLDFNVDGVIYDLINDGEEERWER